MEFTELQLAKFIENKGGDLWLVGGAVRDSLLGVQPKDKDFMITGVDIDDIPFDKVVGSSFPVFLVKLSGETCEVAMARKEKKSGHGHKGFEFFTDKIITVKEDLARRDLTINAMAINVLTGEIVDPFGGRDDLKNKILRHTTSVFSEDPLRVFRTARLSARLKFDIAEETKDLMRLLVPELPTLPAERIWKETEKALNTSTPSIFFKTLGDIGALDIFFKEVSNLNVPDKHDGTAFDHTMLVMDAGNNLLERFGLLVHDFGKGLTPPELHPSHHGHDKLGIPAVVDFCTRLRVPKKIESFGILCCREHMRAHRAEDMRIGKFFRWVMSLGSSFELVLGVAFIDAAFREGGNFKEETEKFNRISELSKKVFEANKKITGDMLIKEGKIPGEKFGEILFQRRVSVFRELR